MTNLLSAKEAKQNDKKQFEFLTAIDKKIVESCQKKDKVLGKGCMI